MAVIFGLASGRASRTAYWFIFILFHLFL